MRRLRRAPRRNDSHPRSQEPQQPGIDYPLRQWRRSTASLTVARACRVLGPQPRCRHYGVTSDAGEHHHGNRSDGEHGEGAEGPAQDMSSAGMVPWWNRRPRGRQRRSMVEWRWRWRRRPQVKRGRFWVHPAQTLRWLRAPDDPRWQLVAAGYRPGPSGIPGPCRATTSASGFTSPQVAQ